MSSETNENVDTTGTSSKNNDVPPAQLTFTVPTKRQKNTWGIYTLSVQILTTCGKSLTETSVSHEMSVQNPNVIPELDKVHDYMERLKSMKRDIKKTAANYYKKTCIRYAQNKGTLPNVSVELHTQQLWNQIGSDFMLSPTWKNAEDLYHIIYSSTDNVSDFKKKVEKTWMKTYGIVYSGAIPTGRYVTGIQRIISDKINAMRKDVLKKLSKHHGFKVVKSLSKQIDINGYKRRKINVFNPEFVINIKNERMQDRRNTVVFRNYLIDIHGDKYKEYLDSNDKKGNNVKTKKTKNLFEVSSLTDLSDGTKSLYKKKKRKTIDSNIIEKSSEDDSFLSAIMMENSSVAPETNVSNKPTGLVDDNDGYQSNKLYQKLQKEKKEMDEEKLLIQKEKKKLIELQEQLKIKLRTETNGNKNKMDGCTKKKVS
jgi:hypothetical protein